VTFPAIPLYFNTFFTHFTQSVRKLTQFYTFMRPVGGGACAAHTTFPHSFHKISHALTRSHTLSHTLTRSSQNNTPSNTSFTQSSHALTHLSQSHTPSNISFTRSAQSLHKSLTFHTTAPFGRGGACAAHTTFLTKVSQRVHKTPLNSIKVTQSPHITPIKVTYHPYKAPLKVTRGRSGPAGRGFPRQGS
jgi:hypothetical protein